MLQLRVFGEANCVHGRHVVIVGLTHPVQRYLNRRAESRQVLLDGNET